MSDSNATDLGLDAIQEGTPVYGQDGEKIGTAVKLHREARSQVIPDTGVPAAGAPGLTAADPGYLGLEGTTFGGGMAANTSVYAPGTSEIDASIPRSGDPMRSAGGGYLQVDRGGLLDVVQGDLYIPLSEIQKVTPEGVYLTVTKDAAGNEGWDHKPDWVD